MIAWIMSTVMDTVLRVITVLMIMMVFVGIGASIHFFYTHWHRSSRRAMFRRRRRFNQ